MHGYLFIDQETIRAIVEEDLPPLEEALQRMTQRVAKIDNLPRAPQESVAADYAATEQVATPGPQGRRRSS